GAAPRGGAGRRPQLPWLGHACSGDPVLLVRGGPPPSLAPRPVPAPPRPPLPAGGHGGGPAGRPRRGHGLRRPEHGRGARGRRALGPPAAQRPHREPHGPAPCPGGVVV